jgi:hypothetical protein
LGNKNAPTARNTPNHTAGNAPVNDAIAKAITPRSEPARSAT